MKNKISKIVIVFIAVLSFYINSNHSLWDDHKDVVKWDIISYYQYLPALIHYNDLGFTFVWKDRSLLTNKFWPSDVGEGKLVGKTSIGMSIIYAPFYLIAELQANLTNQKSDGFSKPYMFWLLMSALFYLILGLTFLRKILLKYYSDLVTSLVIALLFAGTNLLFYSTLYGPMPHVYLFSLITIFVYYSMEWHKNQTYRTSIILGLLLSIISLIRPTDVLVVLFFIFYGISSFKDLISKFTWFLQKWDKLLFIALLSFVFWIPQVLYWKHYAGSYFFFSYGKERFFFDNPQIIKTLFSYRKGLFIYAPVLFLSFVSIPFIYKKHKDFLWPTIIFMILNIYVISSWWCWWYGGSYGSRVYIDSFVFFAIPLAYLINISINKSKLLKYVAFFIVFVLIAHQSFQLLQYKNRAIHHDSMSKEAYWSSFLNLHHSLDFYFLLRSPDYSACVINNRFDTKPEIISSKKIALRYNNKYLSCDLKKDRNLFCYADYSYKWEILNLDLLDNNCVSIKNFEGKYFSINNDGFVVSKRKAITVQEMFLFEYIDETHVKIMSIDNKYFFVDKSTKQVFATDESIGNSAVFEIINKY